MVAGEFADMSEELAYTDKRAVTAREHIDQAAKLQERGLLIDAVSEMKKAVRLSTDKAPVYKELAGLYRNLLLGDEAIASIKKAIHAKPDDIPAREFLLEMLLEQDKFDEIISECTELLRRSKRNLIARDILSIAYFKKGMVERALQITNEMIRLYPTSPLSHFKKGVLCQHKGDIRNAVREFSRVLDMEPDDELAEYAQQAVDNLDSGQLRNIVVLAMEDYTFRSKLIRDPESAVLEKGYHLSYAGISSLAQIRFDSLPDNFADTRQKHYN